MKRWWRSLRKWRRCPHVHLNGIYGDEINFVGGWRLQCGDCGRYLDGPVSLSLRDVLAEADRD